MKKIIKMWICEFIILVGSYLHGFFFAMNRKWVPVAPDYIVQSEWDYLLQQLQVHDPNAYLHLFLIILNIILIISATIYTIKAVRMNRKKGEI